jgi:hypothetical protein
LVGGGQIGRLFYNHPKIKDLLRKLHTSSDHTGQFGEKVAKE